jgi:DNA-binding LacI/PurR family transcriptional regulator
MACLIRRLGGWSVLCREVMEGFSDACAGQDIPILLVHSRELLAQKSSHAPVVLATPAIQTAILQDFLRVYAGKIGGLLLDEIWCDEAIESVRSGLPGTVIFHKESSVREIGNVAADFEAGAFMGLGHLFLCGYEHLVFVDLFGTYEPAIQMLDRAQNALVQLGGRENTGIVRSERGMNAFIAGLSRSKQRVGFFCTDDYAALHLLEKLKAAKIAVPGRAGVLSTMGTHVAVENHLTTLSYDFPAMGAKAAEMLFQGQRGRTHFTPRLAVGETTG